MNMRSRSMFSIVLWASLCLFGLSGDAHAWGSKSQRPHSPSGFDECSASEGVMLEDEVFTSRGHTMCNAWVGKDLGAGLTRSYSSYAIDAFSNAHALLETSPAHSLLNAEVVALAEPTVSDYAALLRSRALLGLERYQESAAAARVALRSPDSTTRTRARVLEVKALLLGRSWRADKALSKLRKDFPELSQLDGLDLLWGQKLESQNRHGQAAIVYREIVSRSPASASGVEAYQRIKKLAADHKGVRLFSNRERISLLEHLVWNGPFADARELIKTLRAEKLSRYLLQRVDVAAARLARVEGRFADEKKLLLAAYGPSQIEPQLPPEKRLRRLKKKGWLGQPANQLQRALGLALAADDKAELSEIVAGFEGGQIVLPAQRLAAAELVAGSVPDLALSKLLEPALGRGSSSLRARTRYHYGRALERAGKRAEARRAFASVAGEDKSGTSWYTMLADIALARLACKESCTLQREGFAPSKRTRELNKRKSAAVDYNKVAGQLEDVAAAYDEKAWPFLKRAAAFLRMHDTQEAGRALYESFLQWRRAIGSPISRTGFEAVVMGASRASENVPFSLRAERRKT